MENNNVKPLKPGGQNEKEFRTTDKVQMPEFDYEKEMQMIDLNRAMLEARLLQVQLTNSQMEIRATKVNHLNGLLPHIESNELQEKIKGEIAKLLGELISIPVS